MTKRTALAVVAAAVAVVVAVALLWRMPRSAVGAELLFAERISQWQVLRSAELRRVDSPAARSMLRTARPWPALVEALSKLDRAYPDDVTAIAAENRRICRSPATKTWAQR